MDNNLKQTLTKFRQALEGKVDYKLEDYAKVDGNYPTMHVGLADDLYYKGGQGSLQTKPFVFQATGTDSNTSTVQIGNFASFRSLRGNSVALNQLAQNGNFSSGTTNWYATSSNGTILSSDNVLTYTLTNIGQYNYSNSIGQYAGLRFISGHKFLIMAELKSSKSFSFNIVLTRSTPISSTNYGVQTSNNWQTAYCIGTVNATETQTIYSHEIQIYVDMRNADIGDTYQVRNVRAFDLTLMFGAGNEPTSVVEFNRLFPKPYYEYNAGELLSCKVNGIKNVGYNAFDGEIEGGSINGSTGENISPTSAPNNFRAKNYIRVIQGETYTFEVSSTLSLGGCYLQEYDANKNFIQQQTKYSNNSQFTLTNNTCYVRFQCYKADSGWGTTPPTQETAQIAFHLTWDGSRTGYEEYKTETYPLPNIELRSAGSAYDELKPEGTLIRRVGIVDLGSLDGWANYGTGGTTERVTTSALSSLVKSTSSNVKANLITSKFIVITYDSLYSGNNGIALNGTTLYIKAASIIGKTTNADIKQALQGVYLFYELATPTEEQTDNTFQQIQPIDDFGTQEFLYDSDIDIPIPQGYEAYYPANYTALVDQLYRYTDGDVEKLVLTSELSSKINQHLTSITGYDSSKTQTLKNVNGVLTWVDD